MGLFSSKKKVYVASTVYSMVGDEGVGGTFMQQALTSAILSNDNDTGLGNGIVQAHLRGPRNRQRQFFRWAKDNFDYGMPRAAVDYTQVIDHDAVAAEIKTSLALPAADSISIPEAFIDSADEAYYAEQYILENHPEKHSTTWAADYSGGNITIQFADSTSVSFAVPGFNSSNNILIAYYYHTISPNTDAEPIQIFIYELGTGNSTLDNFRTVVTDGSSAREFYPVLPLRIDNENPFSNDSPAKSKREDIEKAYDKSIGGDINDLISEIEDNPDISDIDYAYLVFGIPLNTNSQFGKRYLWQFMKSMADTQGTSNSDYEGYQAANNGLGYHPSYSSVARALAGESDEVNTGGSYATATQSQAPQVSNVHLTLPSSSLGVLDMKITWSNIKEERKTGVISAGAKTGQVEISTGGVYRQEVQYFGGGVTADFVSSQDVDAVIMKKQINALEYIELTISGLAHKNLIYDGKSVDISAREALDDPDDSGFLFPLHEPTLKKMGLTNATEISRDCYFLVFNSYKVVKKKWYQTGIFRIFLVIAVIVAIVVITVVTAGTGTPLATAVGSGILGSSAAIGVALGFSGLLALAIGAAVNVIAGMIITQLITTVVTKAIGGKIGRILATVIALVVSFGPGPNGFSFGNISTNVASMAHIDKLLLITSAGADIVSVITQANIAEIQADLLDVMTQHDEELDRLKEAYEALGFGDRVIDPMMLVDFTDPKSLMGAEFVPISTMSESMEGFLSRTLATSSDLIELSNGVISDFADVSLTLS